MTTFGAYLWGSGLPGDRTYALAIPELSYPTYKGDLTDAKDFYLYSVDVADAKINGTADAWLGADADRDDLYLLPAALSYLAAAAKESGHVIIDVAVPGWDSIAYESLPFLYINNDKMMLLQRKSSRRIQLAVGGADPAACDLSLDLHTGSSEVGKSGVFRITESTEIRDYAYLEPAFVHRIEIRRDFIEYVDTIFVADVFGNVRRFAAVFAGRHFPDPASAMRQVLAVLAGEWDVGHKDRGFNIAAALGVRDETGITLAAFVLNEKKRSRIAHAETRLVSFMNVACRQAEWEESSPVVTYIARLAKLREEDVMEIRAAFLMDEKSAARLEFFSSFQPCYMCRAEPDGATLDRISAVNGTAIAPDGRSLRSSFGGTYLSRMEDLHYYDMDSNIFYPRVVTDRIAHGGGGEDELRLRQIPAAGYASPRGQPVFGPVAIGNAKEEYGTDAARARITNSSYLPVVDNGSLGLAPDAAVKYKEPAPEGAQPIGITTTLAPAGRHIEAVGDALPGAVPASGPPAGAVPGAAPPAGGPASPLLDMAAPPAGGAADLSSGAVPAAGSLASPPFDVAPVADPPAGSLAGPALAIAPAAGSLAGALPGAMPTVAPASAAMGAPQPASGRGRALGISTDQLKTLQRAAVLLGTLSRS